MSQALHALQLSHRQSSYHAPSQATTGLETGILNGIVANSSRALLVESPSRVWLAILNDAHYAPRGASMTVTTIVDCWLVKIIVL